MKKYFVKLMSRLLHSSIHQVMRYFWVFIVNQFFLFMEYFFFSRKLFFLWSPCLLLIAESVILHTSVKPTVEFFLKITSPSLIIMSISLDELNSNNLTQLTDFSRADDEFSWNFNLLLEINFDIAKKIRGFLESLLFEYYFFNIIVNVLIFSDVKFEYYCE